MFSALAMHEETDPHSVAKTMSKRAQKRLQRAEALRNVQSEAVGTQNHNAPRAVQDRPASGADATAAKMFDELFGESADVDPELLEDMEVQFASLVVGGRIQQPCEQQPEGRQQQPTGPGPGGFGATIVTEPSTWAVPLHWPSASTSDKRDLSALNSSPSSPGAVSSWSSLGQAPSSRRGVGGVGRGNARGASSPPPPTEEFPALPSTSGRGQSPMGFGPMAAEPSRATKGNGGGQRGMGGANR